MLKKSVASLIIASHCLSILPVYAGKKDLQGHRSHGEQKQHRATQTRHARVDNEQLVNFRQQRNSNFTDTLAAPRLLTFAALFSLLRPGETAPTRSRRQSRPQEPTVDFLFPYPLITTDEQTGVIKGIFGYSNVPATYCKKFLDGGSVFSGKIYYASSRDKPMDKFEKLRNEARNKNFYDFLHLRNYQVTELPLEKGATYGFLDLQPTTTISSDANDQKVVWARLGSTTLSHAQFLEKCKRSSGKYVSGEFFKGETRFTLSWDHAQIVFREDSENKLNKIGAVTTLLLNNILKEQFEAKYFLKDIDTLEPMFLGFSSLSGGSLATRIGKDVEDEEDYSENRAVLTPLFLPSQSEEVTTSAFLTQSSTIPPMLISGMPPVQVTINNDSAAALNFGLVLGVAGVACGSAVIFYCVKKCTRQASHSGRQEGGSSSFERNAFSSPVGRIINQEGTFSKSSVNSSAPVGLLEKSNRYSSFFPHNAEDAEEEVTYSKIYEGGNEAKFHNGVLVVENTENPEEYTRMKPLNGQIYQNADASSLSGGTSLEQFSRTGTFPPTPPRSDSLPPEVRAPLLSGQQVYEEGIVLPLLSKKAAPLSTGQVAGEEPGYMPMDRAKRGYL